MGKNISKRNTTYFRNKRPSYPQWFIDEIYNESDRELARNGELTSRDRILFVCNCCGEPFEQAVYNRIRLSTGERPVYSSGKQNLGYCNSCRNKDIAKKSWSTLVLNNYRGMEEMAFQEELCNLGYNAFHVSRVSGLKEGDIVVGNKVVEFDGWAHHRELPWNKPGRVKMGSGKYVGYHHNKDIEIEKKGFIIYHVVTEDFSLNPVEEASRIIDWLENGVSSVPSKFDIIVGGAYSGSKAIEYSGHITGLGRN